MSDFDDIDSSVDEEIQGKLVNPHTLDPSIVDILRPYGSLYDCRELTHLKIPLCNLRTENRICVRQYKKGKYGLDTYPTSLNGLRIFEVTRGGGSSGSEGNPAATVMLGTASKPYLNTDPTVSISEPKNGIPLNLSDKNYFSKNIVIHTVQEGETAESIVKQITGKSDLSAIVEMKPKPYQQGDKVLSGYQLSIENGLALNINGSLTNSETVNITLTGAATGSVIIELGKAGVNEYVSWATSIPINGAGTVSIKAKAGSAIANSDNEVTPLHWLKIKYLDDNNNPVPNISYCITCKKDNKKIIGELKNGAAKAEGLTPGTVDVEFIHDYDKRQKKCRKELKAELDNAIAYAKQESTRLEKEWAKQPWWNKPVILGGVVLKGTMEWVSDTVTGVYSIIDTVNKTGSKVIVETSKLAAHKAQLFEAYYSNDTAKIESEKAAIAAIQTDMGESIDSAKDSLESLAILATDSETYQMLYDFPGTYFDALSFTEKTHFVFRYGIDIALVFVGGVGIGVLAIKNTVKITAIVKKATELIKLKRFKQTMTSKKTNTIVDITPPPKVTSGKGSNTNMDGHKIYASKRSALESNPNATYRFSDPTYRSTGGDVYFGENVATSYFEVRKNLKGKSLFVGEVKVDNVLDLTDPKIIKEMNIDSKLLTTKVGSPLQQKTVYEYTTKISNQAYDTGYNGIIYSSSRKSVNNKAVILFEGRYDPDKIKPIIDTPIK